MGVFHEVVDEYDRARPSYPAEVFDALEPLTGRRVLDGGAGTGIATRALQARGAHVVAFDISEEMLRRAQLYASRAPVVAADGAFLPFRSGWADLICFAQSWHWLDPERGCAEAARVLVADGRWCGWWSHARADGDSWFDDSWSAVEAACPGTHRGQRDIDWGEQVASSGRFVVADRITVAWLRHISVEQWITELRSHSYVAALSYTDRDRLLDRVRRFVSARFTDGAMAVPYETWLWVGRAVAA